STATCTGAARSASPWAAVPPRSNDSATGSPTTTRWDGNMTSKNSKRFDDVRPGEALPELAIPITTTLIASAAIATRDYFPGHHDMEAAQQLGSPHVFMNILATSGLAQRFVEGWAGPAARFKDLKIKLGAPNYPGDTMTFSGEVV